MKIVGQLVGGPCDGVMMDPSDPAEPHDWPDVIPMKCNKTGRIHLYNLRMIQGKYQHRPEVKGGTGYFYFDFEKDEE
jgi:hypothetical protein